MEAAGLCSPETSERHTSRRQSDEKQAPCFERYLSYGTPRENRVYDVLINTKFHEKNKGKAVPVTGREGP
jgi:hypothetical protein